MDHLFVDRRPIFTIGAIWFDFAKRLPMTRPRYKRELTEAERAYQESMQQANAEQLAKLATLQSQVGYYQPRQPYWGPIGAGIFGNYPSPYP